ncbi:hypothetical protein PAP_03095 [Palaeococcus pacificus DY20341]|uniref:Transcription regulator TrmB N-terminal domain-containing protein n=1 Tax=Palaeococcus pacificus DY20341 TaxID=1343739 RepID=A0A075LRT4_9EURY|nr:helix-turn-helix domain-containing protein [Palaeococcus pacificus]AIF69039.1 hypothetical protein PAP_03095 [Palaeococcus pacificus DY20341]
MKKALIMVVLLLIPLVSAQYTYDLTLTVYRDGYVNVNYQIVPNEFTSQISLKLLGSNYEDLFVTDESGTPLSYELNDDEILINVGDAQIIEVTYNTPDLTKKEGLVWSISVESDMPVKIILPEGSTIVDLSDIPMSIQGETVEMPSGNQSVSYVLSSSVSGEVGDSEEEKTSYSLIGVAIILIIGVVAMASKLLRKGKKEVKLDKEAFLKKMERFELNDEERKALLYILEKGGRASQAEVRNALGIPKTTAWRMFQRFEKNGLVKIIRGSKENWIELKP